MTINTRIDLTPYIQPGQSISVVSSSTTLSHTVAGTELIVNSSNTTDEHLIESITVNFGLNVLVKFTLYRVAGLNIFGGDFLTTYKDENLNVSAAVLGISDCDHEVRNLWSNLTPEYFITQPSSVEHNTYVDGIAFTGVSMWVLPTAHTTDVTGIELQPGLSVSDSQHSVFSDNIDIQNPITIQDAEHSVTSDELQFHVAIHEIQDTLHHSYVQHINLAGDLIVDDCDHYHNCNWVAPLTFRSVLGVDDSEHNVSSTNVEFTEFTLSLNDSTHSTFTDNIRSVPGLYLGMNPITHTTEVLGITLTQYFTIAPQDTSHSVSSDQSDVKIVLNTQDTTHNVSSTLADYNPLDIHDTLHNVTDEINPRSTVGLLIQDNDHSISVKTRIDTIHKKHGTHIYYETYNPHIYVDSVNITTLNLHNP